MAPDEIKADRDVVASPVCGTSAAHIVGEQTTATAAGVSIVINDPTFLIGDKKAADQSIREIKKGLDELAPRTWPRVICHHRRLLTGVLRGID